MSALKFRIIGALPETLRGGGADHVFLAEK
jgi:hypothetical protein